MINLPKTEKEAKNNKCIVKIFVIIINRYLFTQKSIVLSFFPLLYLSTAKKLTIDWLLTRDLAFILCSTSLGSFQKHLLVGVRHRSPATITWFVPSSFLWKQPWYILSIFSLKVAVITTGSNQVSYETKKMSSDCLYSLLY